MSDLDKQRIAGVGVVMGAFLMVFSIGNMIPYGISGNFSKAREWFIITMFFFVIGSVSVAAYYYYRSQNQNKVDDMLSAGTKALANAGHQAAQDKQKTQTKPAVKPSGRSK